MRSRCALVCGAVFVGLMLASAGTGDALVNVDNTIHTGVFSVANGQVARVHVQHVAGRGAKCEVMVRFRRAGNGEQLAAFTLTPTGDDTESSSYAHPVPAGQSFRLRAVVELTPTAGGEPNGNCIVSAEVADRATGRTEYMLGDAVQFELTP